MNVFPRAGSSAAASIAGTSQAAASTGNVSRVRPASGNLTEKIQTVGQGDPAGDPAADGRQLLDTFERQAGGDEDDETDAEGAGGLPAQLPRGQLFRQPAPPPPADLDLQA